MKENSSENINKETIMNEQYVENKEELQTGTMEQQNDKGGSDIYATKEIEIEEVAIDGICGVY